MKRLPFAAITLTLSAATLGVGLASSPASQATATETGAPSTPVVRPSRVRPTAPAAAVSPDHNDAIRTYCVGCHNDKVSRGELSLASFDVAKAGDRADVAEKIVRKLRTGLMPPQEAARKPDAADSHGTGHRARDARLDAAAPAHANPGRRAFQRLNRAEYAAAIRTLFGLDIDVSTYLPADTISASFDNIADVQMPSATVMQGYLRAAAHVSRVAVGDPSIDASSTQYRGAADEIAERPRRRRAVRYARRHRRRAQLPGRRQLRLPAAAPRRADRVPLRPDRAR